MTASRIQFRSYVCLVDAVVASMPRGMQLLHDA